MILSELLLGSFKSQANLNESEICQAIVFKMWSCPIPGSGSSYTVWMVVTDHALSHGGGQKRQFTLLHQLPDTLLCVGISGTYNKSKCTGQGS